MKRSAYWVAWCSLATLAFAAPLSAQGPIEGEGSMAVGNATVSVGGGTAILTLPDVPSFVTLNSTAGVLPFINTFKFSDDFGDEIGWNVNGSIEAPMGANRTVSLNGFWANIDDDDSFTCAAAGPTQACIVWPLVDNPAVNQLSGTGGPTQWVTNAERDVDHWGVSLEVKQQMNPGVMGVTQAPPRRTIALGADIRGIDQDLNATTTITAPAGFPFSSHLITYNEDLDTTYYGAYAAWGGDFPRLVLGGLWERWGLHSTFQLRGGVYYADTDYEGRLVQQSGIILTGNPTSALSLSDDDVAFIGGLVMETSKRIGQRASLSLKSEYEYYSYVPEMAYNQVDGVLGPGGRVGTVIGDDDAFSMRSSLRLTIGLGPRTLYQEPMK